MAIGTFAGGVLSIGTTAAIDFSSRPAAISAFEADFLNNGIVIGGLNNMGEVGAAANIVQFPLVSDDFVAKSKGTRNAGDPAVIVGRLSDDPGQIRVREAEATKYYYNFKLELEDAENETMTNTVIYFRALVGGIPNQFGGNEDFVTETYTLAIYPRPIYVESSPIPSP